MLRDLLHPIQTVTYPVDPKPVERTVAESVAAEITDSARAVADAGQTGRFHVQVGTSAEGRDISENWIWFSLLPGGSALLAASDAHWLYAGFCLLKEEWLGRDEEEFQNGTKIIPTFPWLRNLSDFFVGSLRSTRGFEPAEHVRQIARLGFSHVTINGLGSPVPFETGPSGDVYHWFYDYSPDLDQFVDSALLRGYYPGDYLQKNLDSLKRNAELAATYGLTPGLHINSPRSMPHEFWDRYGFLRGARVDHPRETLRPRYTLAMAHPVVQNHYRELVQKIMKEVPEIGFIHVWTNDSGSGFEFVSSLYAGRNGGPYLLREWTSDEEIARVASGNVMTYYRLLRDEARKVNPGFRLVCDLGPFFAERKYILPELGDGIDAGEFAFFQPPEKEKDPGESPPDLLTHLKLDLADNNVPGLPFPKLVHERLMRARSEGARALLTSATPETLAPFEINGEVVRAVQLQPERPLQEVLLQKAAQWTGGAYARQVLDIWLLSDAAVRAYPPDIPMSTFGFPWFRLWVRPFVPNIDAIPEKERAYYEEFLLATFNNPARVDLNNDMMWNFLTVEEAARKKGVLDSAVIPPLDRAVERAAGLCEGIAASDPAEEVLFDLRNRLRMGRCFFTTMRNTLAWTESVHGYLEAKGEGERDRYRKLCGAMVDSELQNTRSLLDLWKGSRKDLVPISTAGESLHTYGENFPDLLEKKITLMERHRDDEPYIDPDYMWRMPEGTPRKV
jgi:hypothetical protein